MKNFIVSAAIAVSSLGASVQAEDADKPVVLIELFTSQGCYSCPPADDILHALAQEEDILALSLHVDYWDYIGWKDVFAIPKFGERQASYNAQIINRSRRVTPQMIFQGVAEVAGGVGASVLRIDGAIKTLRGMTEPVEIDMKRDGNVVAISLNSKVQGLTTADISLVRYEPTESVEILRGENAGKTLEYTNIVKSLEVVSRWEPSEKGEMEITLPQDGHYAIIVQGKRFGPVYVARKIPAENTQTNGGSI